jgi:hypothetical protein
MAITALDKNNPHFRARITILQGKDGGEIFFGFPSSGVRTAAVEMPDVSNVRVLGIYHTPRARLEVGRVSKPIAQRFGREILHPSSD